MATLLRLLFVLLFVNTSTRASAQAALDTCLVVTGGESGDFEKLVRSELLRHPGFRVADEDCDVELHVERLVLDGEVFLTGRLSAQVPHRVRVEGGRYDHALSELLRIVLGQDPLTLLDPQTADRKVRAMLGPTRKTRALWAASVTQTSVFVPGGSKDLPGLSLSYHRELDIYQLSLRVDAAFFPSDDDKALHPTFLLSAMPELAVFTSTRTNTAGFFALGLGLLHQRFRGPVQGEPNRVLSSYDTGPAASLRLGMECLRSAEARLRVYVEGMAPMFSAHDARRDVINAWVPTLTVGAGLMI